MPTYAYKAIQASGGPVSGVLTAESHQVALRQLEEQSLFPVHVEEAVSRSVTGGRKRVKLRYLTTFYQQMADLLRAGVPMLKALDVLGQQKGSNPVLRQIVREVREKVAGGTTLAEALGEHPHVFKDLHCAMIRAGERGGFLEEVLTRLAGFAEKQDEMRNKLIGSMIYPAILMFAGIAVVTFIMSFVVPKLQGYLREESYNAMTRLVFGISHFIRDDYGLVLGGIAAILIGGRLAVRTAEGQRLWAIFKLRVPMFGKINTSVAVSRFCRILGTMLQNGVPILQSLKISKDSAGNVILAGHIDTAAESVRRGETLSKPLGESGLFPEDILSMIAVAEESNNLDTVLIQIADTQESRTGRTVDMAVRMVEPLLLMMMAVAVGVIAFALLLPILTMGAGQR
ncbi:MAG: type II secretion system F family protein [Phycisphaerales bacterium]|nr:type II secretion system F family protein [Phycisphaerales bacterium]